MLSNDPIRRDAVGSGGGLWEGKKRHPPRVGQVLMNINGKYRDFWSALLSHSPLGIRLSSPAHISQRFAPDDSELIITRFSSFQLVAFGILITGFLC